MGRSPNLAIQCDRLPQPGETLLGGEFTRYAGGKGANQVVAAARAGARVTFIGAHGADDFGRAAKAGLKVKALMSGFSARQMHRAASR
ncbi:MAG: PfkB family carbohydrate kinase [Verrucomicrobiota bacterium]